MQSVVLIGIAGLFAFVCFDLENELGAESYE
jgi:hypothetical protein